MSEVCTQNSMFDYKDVMCNALHFEDQLFLWQSSGNRFIKSTVSENNIRSFFDKSVLTAAQSCGWRRGYSLWGLSAQLIRGLCQRKIQLFLPGCTSKYTILCWWIQHSAVGYFCAQKQDAVFCTGYCCSPKLLFWQGFRNKILVHWDFSAGSHDAQDSYITLLRS